MKPAILTCLFYIAGLFPGGSQADAPLFASDSVIDLRLTVDFDEMCRPREAEDCDFTPSVLAYGDGKQSIPIEIKVRGGWRSLTRNCSVPLLWVRFDDRDTAGTPFEGQRMLPLSTHCGRGRTIDDNWADVSNSTREQYVLREYLGYRLYQLITSRSIRARLARISYVDPQKPRRSLPRYAFFTEHFESVAARNNVQPPSRGNFDPGKLDMRAADLNALFQFMLGHTDWSIPREHNIALLVTDDGRQVPLPYDLDMSGLVDAHYAGPPPDLPIANVRQRFYLGYCEPGKDWDSLFEEFAAREASVLSMVEAVPGFDKASIRSTRRYLEKFFEILNSKALRDKRIVQACQPWPPSSLEAMG